MTQNDPDEKSKSKISLPRLLGFSYSVGGVGSWRNSVDAFGWPSVGSVLTFTSEAGVESMTVTIIVGSRDHKYFGGVRAAQRLARVGEVG
jgi:hypothetical protein